MSLLAFITQEGQVAPEAFTGPTSPPYNVDTFLTFMDPYGQFGSGVHVDVLDFRVRGWRGWRYWMVFTPYHNKNVRQENPCVFAAHEPTKFVPVGANPVYPAPTNPAQWNSDTELLHDPTTDELILMFRDGDFIPNYARTDDGITWPAQPTVVPWPGVTEEILSPSYVHDGTQWVAWGIQHDTRAVYRWTAPAPEGPWSAPQVCTGFRSNVWHFNIVQDDLGKFYCLSHLHNGTAFALSSTDGITWVGNPARMLEPRGEGYWDGTEMYRSGITLHENGTHMRVWYTGHGTGSDSWRVGYTQIPLSEWP